MTIPTFLYYTYHMDTIVVENNTCPMSTAVEIIGGKWKTVILYHLLDKEVMRFGELKTTLTGVTQKMLTAQLRALENDGLIKRKVYPVIPPKVEYSLTKTGESLGPILLAMKDWGYEYLESSQKDVTNTE